MTGVQTCALPILVLCLALSYGGREAIASAARTMARAVARGELDPDSVDSDVFGEFLPSRDLPPLDLLIRTSGERRISNFFLWELAYAELHFSPVLWPDFGEAELWAALRDYANRERRYGLTSAQVDGRDGHGLHAVREDKLALDAG